jgi:hypothetical protein
MKFIRELLETLRGEPGAWKFKDVSFDQLVRLHANKREGIVCLGAGGDLNHWIDGITEMLNDEGITVGDMDIATLHDDPEVQKKLRGTRTEKKIFAPNEIFSGMYKLTTSGGRIDLVLFFKPGGPLHMGKMAMWRLRFGECSWISDYLQNYGDQHTR